MANSSKSKKERGEDQRVINAFIEIIQRAVQIMDFELGDGKNVPKFVKHDGYTYTVALSSGKKLKFNIEML